MHALDAMDIAPKAHPNIARFASPLTNMGIVTGVIIAGLGALPVCYRYADGLPLTAADLARRFQREKAQEAKSRVNLRITTASEIMARIAGTS